MSDIGARAQAGLTFAVAERQGDWTAIWFNGVKGWFLNPASDPTAVPVKGSYVVPKAGLAKAPVYGRAYPEASAYPAGIPVQALAPLQYSFAAGQRYAVGDLTVPTDYYRAVDLLARHPERPPRRRRAGPLLPDLARPPLRLRPRRRRRRRHGPVARPLNRREARTAASPTSKPLLVDEKWPFDCPTRPHVAFRRCQGG